MITDLIPPPFDVTTPNGPTPLCNPTLTHHYGSTRSILLSFDAGVGMFFFLLHYTPWFGFWLPDIPGPVENRALCFARFLFST